MRMAENEIIYREGNNKVTEQLNESYDLINQWVHEREVQE